jgi:hypothetical protein
MSSYNLLKAAADGLADAINYRTNLKRRRREEEYNYNRDWQRNENEYQRDLGRKRDELDYMTDYNWKQEQRAYDRGIERKNQEREANKARILDFVDTYNPANVNRHDWADVQNFNTNAIANDIPLSIKYENLENLNKSLQDKMAVLKQQHDYKMAEIAANRMGRGGSVRQPRALSEIEAYAKNPELMKSFWEDKYGVRGGSPRAVKGGSGKGAVMGEYNWEEDKDLYKYIQDINTTRKAISDQIMRSKIPDTAKQLLDKIIGIQFETEDEKKKVIEQYEGLTRGIEKNEKQALDYHFNNLLATENYLNNLLRKKTNGKYQWDRNLNDFYNVEERKAKADLTGKAILENMKKGNSDLLGKSTRPINIPPAVQPQNNPPASVAGASTDAQKYLRGEMSALEFQQLHPNYPLPQRYY